MTILFRSADLTPGSGRTVHGIGVPTASSPRCPMAAAHTGKVRSGRSPAASPSVAARSGYSTPHQTRRLPIGRAVELGEASDGLHVAFEIAATRDGDDALELVRSGTVDAFSIGFRGIREHAEGDVTVRDEAALMEVSLVGLPAYAGAAIAGVRSQSLHIPRSVAQARLDPHGLVTTMSRNELPIDRMTITQARAAAAEILDSTDGDLTGPDAERFAAITARVEQIRAESQARDATCADLLDGVRSGRYKTEGGRPCRRRTARRPRPRPRDQHRDTALRTLERHVSAGTLPATAAETVESLVEHGPACLLLAARWATETGSAALPGRVRQTRRRPDHGHL